MIRFDNDGFFTKPYNASTLAYPTKHFFHHFPFLHLEVTNLEDANLMLPKDIKIIKPEGDDTTWSGCFAFLDYYDPQLFDGGPMAFRKNSKKNIALLDREERVWVRNSNYKGETVFSQSEYGVLHEGDIHYFSTWRNQYDWVLMTVDNALERIRKGREYSGTYSEKLTEIFLTEKQVQKLVPHHSTYQYMPLGELIRTTLFRVSSI